MIFPRDGSDLHVVPFLKSLGNLPRLHNLLKTVKGRLMMPASSSRNLGCVLSIPMDLYKVENCVQVGVTSHTWMR